MVPSLPDRTGPLRAPVYVVRRHEQWQRGRERVAGNPVSELRADDRTKRGHLDMADIA